MLPRATRSYAALGAGLATAAQLFYITNVLNPTISPQGQAFEVILSRLRALVAHHAARAGAMTALMVHVYNRLSRISHRFDRLAAHWQAGTLPRPRPSRAGTAPSARRATATPARPTGLGLPTGTAWLIRLIQPTAQFAPGIALFLARPETLALVQAAPQAGRLLRPLCRMLAIPTPDYLRLPARPRRPPTPPPQPPKAPVPPRTSAPPLHSAGSTLALPRASIERAAPVSEKPA